MAELLSLTESLCPHCLRTVAARRVTENGSIYLEKNCPTHGALEKVLLWKNHPRSYEEWSRFGGKTAVVPRRFSSAVQSGCPFDCGICVNHQQDTCTAILEVIHHCDLGCPVCFADSKKSSRTQPDQGQIARMLQTLLNCTGPHPIQLSGGEPTLREDLPQIVGLARSMGFEHIQINTNGVRLAQDIDYGKALRDAGATVFFLQFDGLSDDVYRQIRGSELLQIKLQAIERCAELKIGVVLVPTLVKGINDLQIGPIIQFAKRWIPTVKGVHFQPMTYLGRYPNSPRNEDRILIPDILLALEVQTGGELRVENLMPPG